ncbi:hypothetical protein B0A48_10470 [Cryoendolithus antarcticus]|uniref:Uncharacterized protein n=1 Tax=Cryoendolithus antarcticus TaxID=1507870 RepID=A0A1V8SXM7_9PEZI|nr:hypothetical protein B0A48_10470 [Cryoendolithus antarcticus]
MASSHDLERQNNDSLSALSSKVSALRSVTNDIYANARDQGVIDSTSETFSTMTTSMKGSARRLGVMARNGDKVAVMKVAGIIVVSVVVLWWIVGWICYGIGAIAGSYICEVRARRNTPHQQRQPLNHVNLVLQALQFPLFFPPSAWLTGSYILALGPVLVFTLISWYIAAMFRYYVCGQNPTPPECCRHEEQRRIMIQQGQYRTCQEKDVFNDELNEMTEEKMGLA